MSSNKIKPGECGNKSCGSKNNTSKFCGDCGNKIPIPFTKPVKKKVKQSSKSKSPKTKVQSPKTRARKLRESKQRNSLTPTSGKKKTTLVKTSSLKKKGNSRTTPKGKTTLDRVNSSKGKGNVTLKRSNSNSTKVKRSSKSLNKNINKQKHPVKSSSRVPASSESSELFTDSDFPPEISSLFEGKIKTFDGVEQGNNDGREVMTTYRWVRASDIFKNQEFQLFKDGIEPNDIAQGSLGDCYFLSALSAIAEFPEKIVDSFVTRDISPNGQYVLRFCICGEFKEIAVDDYFPCNPSSDMPCFSRANGNELWVMLLEKGWAKINGTYENIIAGHTAEALRTITGAPCTTLTHKINENKSADLDDHWNQIYDGDKRNYVMCASASDSNEEEFKEMGLINSHAYSLIAAHVVSAGSEDVRILQLRNPWGGTEWKGAWADTDEDNWTPELKEQLKWSNEDDGTFWMAFDDYTNYFLNSVICKTYKGFCGSSLDAVHPPDGNTFITFELDHENEIAFFTISQMTCRMLQDDSYEPSPVQMILGRMTGKALETGHPIDFIEACYGASSDVTIEVSNVPAGQYVIFIQGDWKEEPKQCFFNSYSKDEIKLEKVEDWFEGKFLEFILSSSAQSSGKMSSYEKSNQPDIKRCFDLKKNSGYAGYYYENNTDFCTLKETVTFKKLEGLTILPNGGDSFEATVPPHSTRIIILKRDSPLKQTEISVNARPAFIFPEKESDVMAMVESKGVKQQVKSGGTEYNNIFWHFDAGKFLFVNEAEKDECRVWFNFTFDNQDPVTWDFVVSPGERVLKKIDAHSAYKYQYKFNVTQSIDDIGDMHELIRNNGKKGQAGKLAIYYYYLHYGNDYLWLYDNEDSKGYKLNCTFQLTNLTLDGESEGASTWTIELPPGSNVMRKMLVTESKPFNFQLSMSVVAL